MGQTSYTYAGTSIKAKKGFILIPEFAQEWVGAKSIKITKSGNYADLIIPKTKKHISGHILNQAFTLLKEGKQPEVSFEETLYDDSHKIYSNKVLEKMRIEGIYSKSIIRITEEEQAYDSVVGYSETKQFL